MGVTGRMDVGTHLIFSEHENIFKNGTVEDRGTVTEADTGADTNWLSQS
jgi:hypothetical protein